MNIEQVNATLVRAIESFQADELDSLWETFMVPSPHAMHRQYGMPLPKGQFTVPTPSEVMCRSQKSSKPKVVKPQKKMEPREVSQAEAESGAVKTQDQLQKVFDRLKPKQTVWVSYKSFSSGPRGFNPYVVGRRSHSKKYGVTSITLLRPGQRKPLGPGWQTKLMKGRDGEISLAEGDMATMNLKIYAP